MEIGCATVIEEDSNMMHVTTNGRDTKVMVTDELGRTYSGLLMRYDGRIHLYFRGLLFGYKAMRSFKLTISL